MIAFLRPDHPRNKIFCPGCGKEVPVVHITDMTMGSEIDYDTELLRIRCRKCGTIECYAVLEVKFTKKA